jgi:hypothetical protein
VTVTDIIKCFLEKNKDDNYLAKAMIRYGKYWEEEKMINAIVFYLVDLS